MGCKQRAVKSKRKVMDMDTSNWNIKYIIGNVVIAVVVVWWASVLVKLANSPFETFHMIAIAVIQGILLAVGLRCFIIKPQKIEEKKRECTEPVSAMLVDYQPSGILSAIASTSSNTNYTKYAVYSFYWKGYEMKATSDLPYTGVVRKNLPSEILVNPYNPNEIYEPQIERSRMAHYRFQGTAFIFWGFGIFLFLLGGE